jgi:hypothetical protein
VWPECSPQRIARRTSRGSFMERHDIEPLPRDEITALVSANR